MTQTSRQVCCPYCGTVWDAEYSEDVDDDDVQLLASTDDVQYVVCENCVHYAN